MITPPGTSSADFAAALDGFREIVSPEWVFTEKEDIDLYKDAYSPFWGEPDERVASAAVAPVTVEQVQAIVRLANRYRVPLYPISTGKNLGYGGSAPVLSGSVVLDLKRMNRIIEVNEDESFALVEPGVSYFDLYNYIQEKGLKLWIDTPDPGWGSVIGNALERGLGYTPLPYRDHFGAHCGMEIVLANGELVRTGMGALPGAKSWQTYRYGCGPWVDGLFSQSNFGVVTKIGFWLLPRPDASLEGTITVPRHNDIHRFVALLAKLGAQGVINCAYWIESPFANTFRAGADHAFGATPDPEPAEWDVRAADKGLPSWAVRLCFHGAEAVVRAQWAHVQSEFASIAGATFSDGPLYRHPLSAQDLARVPKQVEIGVPNLAIFTAGARTREKKSPSAGHMWFSPVIPMNGAEMLRARKVFGDALREWGISPITSGLPMHYQERTFLMLFGFEIAHDREVNKKNRQSMRQMVALAAQHGWGEYRTHSAFMDPVVGAYSYNNSSLLKLHETLKDAMDPNGILSAGRYGIWPAHLRQAARQVNRRGDIQ
jgi:(+)-pinoresinol hydroxylase